MKKLVVTSKYCIYHVYTYLRVYCYSEMKAHGIQSFVYMYMLKLIGIRMGSKINKNRILH